MIDEKDLIKDIKECKAMREFDWTTETLIFLLESGPKVSQWIPVSERLPAKPSQRVLVTLENEMVLEVWYINNKFKFLDKMNFEEVSDYNPVIAWQSLPEPYKEENHD